MIRTSFLASLTDQGSLDREEKGGGVEELQDEGAAFGAW
jgi:hypothetical protein